MKEGTNERRDRSIVGSGPSSRRGFVAGATAAVLAAAGLGRFGSDAFAAGEAAEAERRSTSTTGPQYVNPKTYPAFTKATGIKVKKTSTTRTRRCYAKLKAGARGYDLAVPDRLHGADPRRGEAPRADRLVEAADRQEDHRPEVPQARRSTRRSTYSVAKDWGTTGFMYRTRQDQGAADDLEGVRRARRRSTRARSRCSTASPRCIGLDRS